MCPISNTGMPLDLEKRSSADAHSLTCVTLPGELSTSSVYMVWMDNYFGMEVLDLCENILQGCLAKDMDIFAVAFSYALGPHLQLVGALFATYIKDSAFGHVEDGLEGERTLADARLTSQENDGTGNHSTAQHTIEFIVIHVDAWCLFRCNVAQEARMVFPGKRGTYGTGCRPCGLASRIVAYPDFLECVPLSTRRTFAHPFR